ncbi:copper homeostasis protein CutC, partial [Vibrio mediterranei]
MNYQLEVCIDNIESLPLAIAGGATRIELCSSLSLG